MATQRSKPNAQSKVEVDPCDRPVVVSPGDDGLAVAELQAVLEMPVVSAEYDLSTEHAVQRLQRTLKASGHYDGPVDGIYGEVTRDAWCASIPWAPSNDQQPTVVEPGDAITE